MRRFSCLFHIAFLCAFFGNAFAVNFPYSEWSLANYEGAYATFSDGLVSVSNGGSDYWNVQLTRKNIELQSGKTYELRFFLQGVSARRYTEIRIGRDGFPYDAFAEFGEVVATVNGREVTKTFKMNSGNVSNARLEFNFGKGSGSVYFSDVSLNCLDCGITSNVESPKPGVSNTSVPNGFVVVADEVDFRDYSMALGDVFGSKLELGADSKIYGDVSVSSECFLRERAFVQGSLHQSVECTEQNGISTSSRISETLQKPSVTVPKMSVGVVPVSVDMDGTLQLSSGSYGAFYANTRAKIHLSSGSYTFQNFYTEPDVEFTFDMSSGPISINVAGDVRFGDRNQFTISGGNPSEITWNIAGAAVDLGTDGLYYGRFVAPGAYVRVPSRSHLVGGVYASKFVMEPQSTVSQEPRADEISHSEEHFGPFFEPGTFRYRSQLPLNVSSIEMFVYANNSTVKINGGKSTMVELPASNRNVEITVSREMVSGFPVDAFRSTYVFEFTKSSNYRIFWNPQSLCKQGCDGSTAATAIGDFETVLATAQSTGREINMAGGIWDVTDNYKNGVVPWKVGFELVGNTANLWELSSEEDLPKINLEKTSHIEIEGSSPRSLTGLRIVNGVNAVNGGAVNAENQKVSMKNVLISESVSSKDGGAIYAEGSIALENVRFSGNVAKENGGAVAANGNFNAVNVLFVENTAAKNGGAITMNADASNVSNAIFYGNKAGVDGGAIYNVNSVLNLWNATFFANNAIRANGAIAGVPNGVIGNSIFWKNTAGCNTAECGGEVVEGFSATNSSFSNTYAGMNIYVGDPKFADESKPRGKNNFLGYDSGINLSNKSDLIKYGALVDDVPDYDILNGKRKNGNVLIGAYAWTALGDDVVIGYLDSEGNVSTVNLVIPIFDKIPSSWARNYLAKSNMARVIKTVVQARNETKVSWVDVQVSLRDADGNEYGGDDGKYSVYVRFYRVGEINGNYVFQSMTNDKGKPILFTRNLLYAGNFEDATVLYLKNKTDTFHFKVIDYKD